MTRRRWMTKLACGLLAMGLMVAPAVAAELLGVLVKVDPEARKVYVVPKGEREEVEVLVTDDTEYVTPKGSGKIDLEKLRKGINKAKEKGRKGINVKVTHEDRKASKIQVQVGKKKAAER